MQDRRIWVAVSAVLLCFWCGWISGFHRATTPARVTWAFSLAAVVVVNVLLWRGQRGRHPGWRTTPAQECWPRPGREGYLAWVGVSPWLALVLLVLAWEVLGLDTSKHAPHLTISALTEAFRPLNAAMLLVWMLVGIGYGLARARAPVSRSLTQGGASESEASNPAFSVHGSVMAPALLLPSSRSVGVGFWIGVVVLAIAIEFAARHSNGRIANAQELVRLITTPLSSNILLVAAWAYAGYHLFAH